MEELRILAKQYYEQTVDIRLYGFTGVLCLALAIPFFLAAGYLNFYTELQNLSIAPMFIGSFIWVAAKKRYDRNLIQRLTYFSHHDSCSLSEHKALYIQYLTSHIAPNLYEVMKAFRDITEANAKNRSFVLDNGWYHFFRFLYDPEAKNRILSLLIYLISLVAILTVVKPDTGITFYDVLNSLSFEQIKSFLAITIFLILIGYVVVVVPTMFVISYLVVPLLLKFSSASMLSRYFISEINKYTFLDTKETQPIGRYKE